VRQKPKKAETSGLSEGHQSSNEELASLSEQPQVRSLELDQANDDFLNLLSSLDIPMIMVGHDLRIRHYTPQAEKVLNLASGDMGRSIADIQLNINLPDVHEQILETIDTMRARHLEIQNQEGRWYSLRIHPYETGENKIAGAILALVDIHPFKAQMADLSAAVELFRAEIADQRRTLEELRSFKFISDHASDAHGLIDRDGRLLYVNQRACEQLGYSEAELLQMTLSDIDPLCSGDGIRELFQRLEKGEVGQFESLRRRKDGTTFPVEVGGIGLRFEGAVSLFMVTRDITDRKKADRRFHLAVEAAPNAMVMVNQEGKILFVNAQMESLFGYSRDELLGMSVDQLVPERFRSKHAGFRGGFLAGPQARPMGGGRDLYALGKDGGEFPVEIGLNPIETEEGIWVLGAIVDISERKRVEEALRKAHDDLELRVQARTAQLREAVEQLNLQMSERWRVEEALRTSERRYRDLFENANDLLFTLDFQGDFTSLNRTAEQVLGYSREEAAQLNLVRLTLPGEHDVALQILNQEAGSGGKEYELSVRAKDGRSIPLEIRSRWIRENEQPVGVQCVARDITERKRAEQERREVSARLTRLQDDERRRLARELHDSTGQNLAALKMSLGAVHDSPARLDPRAGKALAESQELAEICIREVRTLSYLLHPPLLDERGLAFALRLYAEGYSERSGVALGIEISGHFGRIPQELEIACFRLAQECLTNVHRHSGSPTARIRLERNDCEVRLEVSDSGHGFSAGTVSEREGHGIGIQAMRERAQQLGGHLEIDSSPSGTRVLAVLPLPPRDS
jgi:two-component system, NarL family, sensor kinase